jgi:hypothetical protein
LPSTAAHVQDVHDLGRQELSHDAESGAGSELGPAAGSVAASKWNRKSLLETCELLHQMDQWTEAVLASPAPSLNAVVAGLGTNSANEIEKATHDLPDAGDFVEQPEVVWETLQDDEGCNYYWNAATNETTYDQPSQL